MVNGLLGQRKAHSRLPGNTGRQRIGALLQFLTGHYPVDHAHLVGTLGTHAIAGEQKLLGDARVQLIRVGKILHPGNAHTYHGVLEKRIIAGHDQVAHPGQHQPTGHTRTLDHGNGRLGQLTPAPTHAQVHLLLTGIQLLAAGLVGVIPPEVCTLERFVDIAPGRANVMTGRKMPARPAQYNDLDRVIVDSLAQRRIQRVRHLRVLRIVEAWPVHGQRGDTLCHAVQHRFLRFVDRVVCTLDEFTVRAVHAHVPRLTPRECQPGCP